MQIEKLRKNIFFVGRASTAIYLILKTKFKDKEVILPSNICYSVVYSIIYSGNIPVFVDVEKKTGNTSLKKIHEKINKSTAAIIFPYMYGNLSKNIFRLKKYCQSHNIILIEDCASTMFTNKNKVGLIGDFSIFSTGHAKVVDVGNGGIIITDNKIDDIKREYNNLPFYNNIIKQKIEDFSKEYRFLRNENNEENINKFFLSDYKELFLYKINKETIQKMKSKISEIENIINVR